MIIKKYHYLLILFSIIISCKSEYNDLEYRLFVNYNMLDHHQVAISENNDTIYVYDSIKSILNKMDKFKDYRNRNSDLRLKSYLKANDYQNILNYKTDGDKNLNSLIIKGIAARELDVDNIKYFNKAESLIKKENKTNLEKEFYLYFIDYLKTRDLKQFISNLKNLNLNEQDDNLNNIVIFLENDISDYDAFVKYISENLDNVFLPKID